MHQIVEDNLEELLTGTVDGERRVRVDAHLAACAECREEVQSMRDFSALMQSLRSTDAPAPSPGFYARVADRVDKEQSSSIWAAFLQPAFGRRIAFASLLLLATLGGVLVSSESEYALTPSPEMILAVEQEAPAFTPDQFQERDRMLVTLVSYQQ